MDSEANKNSRVKILEPSLIWLPSTTNSAQGFQNEPPGEQTGNGFHMRRGKEEIQMLSSLTVDICSTFLFSILRRSPWCAYEKWSWFSLFPDLVRRESLVYFGLRRPGRKGGKGGGGGGDRKGLRIVAAVVVEGGDRAVEVLIWVPFSPSPLLAEGWDKWQLWWWDSLQIWITSVGEVSWEIVRTTAGIGRGEYDPGGGCLHIDSWMDGRDERAERCASSVTTWRYSVRSWASPSQTHKGFQ
jgi:hypothetical protein